GGIRIAPRARMDDGLFDIISVGDLNTWEVLTNIHRLYRGTHLSHELIDFTQGRRVAAWSDDTVLLDVDGESLGQLPATFEVLPGRLKIRV
ncbi:MAG: diacylglycerol kinase family lipid kinase, partial [Deltaproteobacteria bacterium]|nr:diacylglycerol kinase family lipid kinase [Deltaproteobacteria bacterium]